MKLRLSLSLSLFLFLACSLLAGSAKAQCIVESLPFPSPSGATFFDPIPPGMCIASINQTGRLRWDNNGSHELQLFDTDDGGALLWCAANSNGCVKGGSLCLQRDGNMVIYVNTTCGGGALWASNTVGKNEDLEVLGVGDGSLGEQVVIVNDFRSGSDTGPQVVWVGNAND